MATYRLWPSTNGGALAAYSGPIIGATQFAVSGGGRWLNGYYIWVPSGGDTSPAGGYNTALWSLITGASSGSGDLVPGSVVTGVTGLTANAWNFIPLTTPIQLAPGWDSNSTGNGSSYVAAVGWTASAGFADTNNYWGTGAGASGITNGPLIAYSSNSGTANKAPYGMAQGLFSDSTSNAAATLPNQVSGTDNFWVDVQVSDTAPSAYAGSYRLWPNKYDANDFTTGDAAVNYTIATEISLSQTCTLGYIWYYSPTNMNGSTAATTLATRCDVWNISTGLSVATITAPAWLTPAGGAGTAGTGWVKAAFAGGTTLPAGDYRVSVYNSGGTGDANWSPKDASTDYWGQTLTGPVGASGITNGPVSAPDYASSQGGFIFSNGATGPPPNAGASTSHAQPTFYQPATAGGAVGFPQLYAPVGGSSNESQNYWVDLEVTPVPPTPVTQPQNSTGLLTARRPVIFQYTQIPPPPPPLPAAQQSAALVARGLPQTLPSPRVQPPPPPGPAPAQGTGLLQRGVPVEPQYARQPSPPPPIAQPQHSAALIARGMATPGNFSQAPPVVVVVPPVAGQSQQALNFLLQGLPATVQQPNLPVTPPPVLLTAGQPQQSVLLMQRGLAQPGNFSQAAPVAPPVVALPGQQQSTLLVQRRLPVLGNFSQAPPVAPPVVPMPGQPQSPLLLRLGLPTPGNWYQATPVIVIPPPPAQAQPQSTGLLRLRLPTPGNYGTALIAPPEPLLDPQHLGGTITAPPTAGSIMTSNYAGSILEDNPAPPDDIYDGTITPAPYAGSIVQDNYAGTIQ